MKLPSLLDRFNLLMDTVDSVPKLRRFVLQLAVQGHLTKRSSEDTPAEVLLEEIKTEKQQHLENNDSPRRKELGPLPNTFPFELPKTWVWARLDEVCPYIQRGKRPDYSEIERIPVVSQKCVQWEGFKPGRVRFIDPDTLDKYQSYRFLREGDLLWNSTGVGTVGRINVYRGELSDYKHAVADSHVTVVRPVKNLVLPEYIYTWIASSHIQGQIDSEMTSGSTKQTELNTSTVRETLLPLPPLGEQERIVATVENLVNKCDTLETRQDQVRDKQSAFTSAATHALSTTDSEKEVQTAWMRIREHFDLVSLDSDSVDELRQAVLQLAIQGRLTEQNPEDTDAEEVLSELAQRKKAWFEKEKEKGNREASLQQRKFHGQDVSYPSDERLPEGWEWATLLESSLVVVDCHNKTAPYVDSGIPLVRTSNIKRGVLHLDDLKYVTEETYEKWARRCPPKPGDILFTREAPIGEAAIIPSGVQLCMGQRMMLIRPIHDLISRQYLLLVLLAPGLLERSPIKQKGSTVKHLRVGDVESIIVPVPPREEQDRIVEKTEKILPLCDSLESQLEQRQTVGSDLMDAVLHPETATPAVAN